MSKPTITDLPTALLIPPTRSRSRKPSALPDRAPHGRFIRKATSSRGTSVDTTPSAKPHSTPMGNSRVADASAAAHQGPGVISSNDDVDQDLRLQSLVAEDLANSQPESTPYTDSENLRPRSPSPIPRYRRSQSIPISVEDIDCSLTRSPTPGSAKVAPKQPIVRQEFKYSITPAGMSAPNMQSFLDAMKETMHTGFQCMERKLRRNIDESLETNLEPLSDRLDEVATEMGENHADIMRRVARLERQFAESQEGTRAPVNPSGSHRERSNNPRSTSQAPRSETRFSGYDTPPAQAHPGPRGEMNEETGERKGVADVAEIASQIGIFKSNEQASRHTDTQNKAPGKPSVEAEVQFHRQRGSVDPHRAPSRSAQDDQLFSRDVPERNHSDGRRRGIRSQTRMHGAGNPGDPDVSDSSDDGRRGRRDPSRPDLRRRARDPEDPDPPRLGQSYAQPADPAGDRAWCQPLTVSDIGEFNGREPLDIWIRRLRVLASQYGERAVVHPIAKALKGNAAVYLASLRPSDYVGLDSIGDWEHLLRRGFQGGRHRDLRKVAEDRIYDPSQDKDIGDYFWAKVALFRTLNPDIRHQDIQYEVWLGLKKNAPDLMAMAYDHTDLNQFRDELMERYCAWRSHSRGRTAGRDTHKPAPGKRPTRASEDGDRPCDVCRQDHPQDHCPKRKSKPHERDATQPCVQINTSWSDGDSDEDLSDEDPTSANVNSCSPSFVIKRFNAFQQTRTINTEAAQIRTIPRADIVGSGLAYLSTGPLPVEVWLGTVNRPTVTGCLDTGGQSIIGEAFLRKHFPEARVRRHAACTSPRFGGIGGGAEKARGYVVLETFVPNRQALSEEDGAEILAFDIEYQVVGECAANFLIGRDAMAAYGIDIHHSTGVIRIGQHEVPIPAHRRRTRGQMRAKATVLERTSIPPQSEAWIKVRLPSGTPSSRSLVFSPFALIDRANQTLAKTTHCLINSETPQVRVTNVCDFPITMAAGMALGTVELADAITRAVFFCNALPPVLPVLPATTMIRTTRNLHATVNASTVFDPFHQPLTDNTTNWLFGLVNLSPWEQLCEEQLCGPCDKNMEKTAPKPFGTESRQACRTQEREPTKGKLDASQSEAHVRWLNTPAGRKAHEVVVASMISVIKNPPAAGNDIVDLDPQSGLAAGVPRGRVLTAPNKNRGDSATGTLHTYGSLAILAPAEWRARLSDSYADGPGSHDLWTTMQAVGSSAQPPLAYRVKIPLGSRRDDLVPMEHRAQNHGCDTPKLLPTMRPCGDNWQECSRNESKMSRPTGSKFKDIVMQNGLGRILHGTKVMKPPNGSHRSM